MSDELNLNEEVKKEKSKPKAWLIGLIIAALILLWVAPPLAAELYLAENIDNFIKAQSVEDVSLTTDTFKLLNGRFDQFVVSGNNLLIGHLKVESFQLMASEGQIAILETIRTKKIAVKESPIASMILNITQEDFKDLLKTYYESLNEIEVVLNNGYIEVSGIADSPRGKSIPIAFIARVGSDDWSSLEVDVVEIISTSSKVVEDDELEELSDIYSIVIPFDKTNPVIYINTVNVRSDGIIINANTSLS